VSSSVGPRVGPSDVGSRVVLRRRLPGGRTGDLLGELLAWGDGVARVATRHGEVEVAIADVVAGKPVPPAPSRRGRPHLALSVEALEDVAADGWRPLEQEWLGPRGSGWRLRAADGFTGRANSVLATGDPELPVPQAIQAVERWYAERGLPARFAVPWALDVRPGTDRARSTPLDVVLAGLGYVLDTPTLVMTAALREVAAAALAPGSTPPSGLRLELAEHPDEGWLGLYHYRGRPLPEVGRRVLESAPAQVFASLRDAAGSVAAVGRGASSRGWTGVAAVEVAPEQRRRGLARAVVGALAEWGLERGDRSGYLQVAEAGTAARTLYRAAGFVDHHGYHYRIAP
jgi:GNAT superfamily N-acetyltransferase